MVSSRVDQLGADVDAGFQDLYQTIRGVEMTSASALPTFQSILKTLSPLTIRATAYGKGVFSSRGKSGKQDWNAALLKPFLGKVSRRWGVFFQHSSKVSQLRMLFPLSQLDLLMTSNGSVRNSLESVDIMRFPTRSPVRLLPL